MKLRVYHLQGQYTDITTLTAEEVLSLFKRGEKWKPVAEVETDDPNRAVQRTRSFGDLFLWRSFHDVSPLEFSNRDTGAGDIILANKDVYLNLQTTCIRIGQIA